MPMSWEQHLGLCDTTGGSATIAVRHRWSAWSADRAVWQASAADALRHLEMMYENTLVLELTSEQRGRSGVVEIVGTSECEDAPAEFVVKGHIKDAWDTVDELAKRLGLQADDVYGIELLRDCLPHCDDMGTVGVARHFELSATSVGELLALVALEEDTLVADSAAQWRAIEAIHSTAQPSLSSGPSL